MSLPLTSTLALSTLLSEDLACVAAGLLIADGRLGFGLAVLACGIGIFLGDLLLFLCGRWLGRPALRRPPLAWLVKPAALARGEAWFQERGVRALWFSRFVPGTRLPTYMAAGVLGTKALTLGAVLAAAAAVWTPLLVGAALLLGNSAPGVLSAFRNWALPVVLALGIGVASGRKVAVLAASWRARRRLVGRWRRIRHWEFWPPWVFQAPVVGYFLWLALRHRSLTAFTAANPAIPTGGLVFESKAAILRGLSARGAPRVARFVDIPAALAPAQRRARVGAFRAAQRLALPLVIKPDVGQRGSGVTVARSEDALATALDVAGDLIVQEFVSGEEFGIFYVRHPSAERGRIISITRKRLPVVHGDGRSMLEDLILSDERAVCMADLHCSIHAARLTEVPRRGEPVPLVELGNHCRGAVFLDGNELLTPALTAAVDELSRGYAGFFFGRYDVRVASLEALKAGEFTVLELNGVASEATHIYAPGASLVAAYRTLFAQWREAFAIGKENIERGHRPTPAGELVRAVWSFLAGERHPPRLAPTFRTLEG